MPVTLVLMLIWVGTAHGGPAVIQGFADLRSCETTQASVKDFYESVGTNFSGVFGQTATKCLEIKSQLQTPKGEP